MPHFSRCLLLCLALLAAPAQAEEAATPAHPERVAYARNFAQTVISVLHNPKLPYGARKDMLRRSFAASVDIDWIARFVLGRSWKDATGEQRQRYTSLYRRFLTETYVSHFAENPASGIYAIHILGVSDEENNMFVVHTQMQLMNQEKLRVDYRACEKDGGYKVLDIVIENVSLINSHRAEFATLAANEGVGGVIKKLEQLLDRAGDLTLSMK